ncbi:hypothetical protein [Longimicrobium sp.]|uniref:hypothetical protein n=1 Tax=Longimicrobium sp. TaxID=2029185 RepID=UPI002E33BC17|nr:hypothetical protein [Longimicrobium sp.]HEX6040696.1 hypothetical protein [Longimicrobium sp.]
MRKLTLEALTVESFETSSDLPRSAGTVRAHAEPTQGFKCQTIEPELCGDTHYFDCTLACSNVASCIPC